MDMREKLKRQAKHQAETKDSGGGGIPCLNIQKDKLFKPVAGKNKIDIIPYLASKNNPDKGNNPGDPVYVLDYWAHRNIGLNHDNIICPAKNYHKPCPICEEIERMKDEGKDWDDYKDLMPKRRVAYNFVDVMKNDKKILVFDVSHFFFEKELLDEALSQGEGDMIDFFSLDEGKTVVFRATEESLGGGKYFKFKSFSFEDRAKAYPERFAKEAFCLDDLLNLLSYDQISAVYFGDGIEADDPDAVNDDDDDAKPVASAKKNSSKKPVEEDDDNALVDDDDPIEEKPAAKKSASKKTSAKKQDDDENECPHGHKFGEDYDNFEECNDCTKWKKCM
jgi:hypothetical protein